MIASLLFQAAPPAAPQSARGSIGGIVLRLGADEPLSQVQVVLKGNSVSSPRASTGSDGRFVLNDVEPGQYTLQFGLAGYITQSYGERVFQNSAMPVVVRAGQTVNDIVMRLTPAGAVSGRIRSAELQPLVGVPVRIFHYVYNSNGRHGLQLSGATTTDDRGEYRLFGITPGLHYLEAGGVAPYPNKTEDINLNTVVSEQPITFYPATPDLSLAKPLDIAPGSDLKGMDFVLERQRLFRIRGRVIGSARTGTRVTASPQVGIEGWRNGNGPVDSLGNFQIDDLGPGEYELSVESEGIRGRTTVQLGEADLDGVALTLRTTANLTGRMMLDGAPWRSTLPFLTNVRLLEAASGENVGTVIEPDGTFTISSVPQGSYRPVLRIPPGLYLKAATYGGVEVIENGLNFDGMNDTDLELQISSKVASLRGTVRNQRSGPSPRVAVLLIPERRDRKELYAMAITKENGDFEMTNLPPGNYKLFAWESIEPFSWHDPAVLARFESKGLAIHLDEGSKGTFDLRVIPAEIQP